MRRDSHPDRRTATTNRDLASAVEVGPFRQDQYYRLSTIPIQIPPWRDRAEDLPVPALCFAMRVANELGKKIEGFSPDALRALQEYLWPRNLREPQRVRSSAR